MDDFLPTDLLISAQARIAGQKGVSIIVTRKGDPARGTIFLKINRLNGTADLYNQIRLDDEKVWIPVFENGPTQEDKIDRYLESQADFDPDLWIVEVEDRTGNLWFPGRVLIQES